MVYKIVLRSVIGSLLVCMFLSLLAACSVSHKSTPQPITTQPEQLKKLDVLNQMTDDMYKLVMEGDISQAKSKLQQIGEQIPQIRFEGITTVEGLNALTESVTQAKRVLNSVSISQEETQVAIAKLRLATDALTHPNQPMWLQYYKLLQEDLDQLEQAAAASKKKEAAAKFSMLYKHYSVIRPSLLINRVPSDVEKTDSLFAFIKVQMNSDPLQIKNIQNGIDNLRLTFDQIFMKRDTTAYLPIAAPNKPIVWSLGIGAVIISILTFAAWRMFRTGRDVVTIPRKEKG